MLAINDIKECQYEACRFAYTKITLIGIMCSCDVVIMGGGMHNAQGTKICRQEESKIF